MINNDSLSIIIPALNEEKNIEPLVSTVITAAKKDFQEYEIIIFNDGSTDKTGEVAKGLASNYPNIKVIHHDSPTCIGGVYKEGKSIAKMRYLILVNGKNDTMVESLDRIFALRGKADMIIPYTLNKNERSLVRRFFSYTFTSLLNSMFGLNLKYYNHYVLHKRELVNSIDVRTNSYAFQAEALIKLIKSGRSYIEVGVNDVFKKGVKTKAFRLKNILAVSSFLITIIYDVYFNRKKMRGGLLYGHSDI